MLKKVSLLLLLAALFVPWTMRAQSLLTPAFATGVDTNRWVTLSSSATTASTTGDDAASSVMNIGFTFSLEGVDYTQWSYNTNGAFRLGSTAMGSSSSYGTLANSSYRPKIAMFARDGLCSQVKYEVVGTAPERMLVIQYTGKAYWSNDASNTTDIIMQLQLSETTNEITLVYGAGNDNGYAGSIGIAGATGNTVVIDGSTHTFTTLNGTSSATTYWPGEGRYYSITPHTPGCDGVEDLALDAIDIDMATISWSDDNSSSWNVTLSSTVDTVNNGTFNSSITSYSFSGLFPNTPYSVVVAGDCDTFMVGALDFRTTCTALDTLPYVQNFEACPTGAANNFDYCWVHTSTYNANYPYVSSSTSKYLYTYLYGSSSYGYAMLPALGDDIIGIDLELVFDAWRNSSASGSQVIVGIFDSLSYDGYNGFDTLAIVNPTATSISSAETFHVYISDQDLTDKRIGFVFRTENTSLSSYYSYIDNVILREAPTCYQPNGIYIDAMNTDSVFISWNGYEDASGYDVVYGPEGFDPDTAENYLSVSDTFVYITDAIEGLSQQVYVRTDCGSDYSYWEGPGSFTPGTIIMGVTGSETRTVCNAVIFDDGGENGSYSNYANYSLTLYPIDSTKCFKFWGSGVLEGTIDYLNVYSGAAAAGNPLAVINGNNPSFDTVSTQGGPITLLFHSDGSVVYSGFAVHVICVDVPPCRTVDNVTVAEVSTASAFVRWEMSPGTTPLPNTFDITVYDTTGSVVASTTSSELYAIVDGLDASSVYTVSVVPICDEGNAAPASTDFTTAGFACLQVDTTQAFADTIGNGTSTSTYLPSYSFFNYGYTQQIFTAAEIGHGGSISRLSFMMANVNQQRTFEIYMGHVSESTATSFLSPADLTCVYNGGSVTLTADVWTTFNLTTPFNYNGIDNLLVVFRDITGSYSSGNSGYVHSAASGAARYVYTDGSSYIPGSVTGGYSLSVRNNIILGGEPCDVESTCAAPILVVTGGNQTSVDLIWASGSGETSWSVEHRADGDNDWTVDYASTTQNSATISNLTDNTIYHFRVYQVCGTDTFATVRTFRTKCFGTAVPFSEDFSTWTTGTAGSAPSCWIKGSSYDPTYPYVTTSYSMGDGKSMYFYTSNVEHTYLALPLMDAPVDTLLVTGYVYYSSNGYQLNVGVMTDPEDYSTFSAVSTVTTVADTWVRFEVGFAGMADGNIAFSVGNGTSYQYLYLDNVEVNYFNPCVRPTGVTASSVTTSSATISWVDTATNDFIVEYGPRGFAHGTGISDFVTGDSVQLTGLNHSTVYEVFVRGICGDGDSSNWSFAYSFATDCDAIDVLPFTENFNTWDAGTSSHAPLCWSYGSDYSSSYPYISSSYDHSGSAGASMYMYLYDNNHDGKLTWFALPELSSSVASVNQTQLVFYSRASTSSYVHNIVVGVLDTANNISSFSPVDTVVATYNVWTEHEVSFDSYTGNGNTIVVATYVDAAYIYSYPYIDDITLELIPSCQRPDSLYTVSASSSTVTVGWHDRANASNWIIEYGPVGFTPGTGTAVAANANPFTLTGLPSSYAGEFYVKAVCSSTDTGEYSRQGCLFNTAQLPATIPYSYDFETDTEWANWQISSNVATTWYRGTAVAADNSNYSMYISATNGTTYKPYTNNAIVNAAAFRDIDFGTVDTSFTISFKARVGGTTTAAYDGLMVFLVDPSLPTVASSSAITSPWGNVNDLYRIATVRLDTVWHTHSASFDEVSGIQRVAFFWFNQNTSSNDALLEPAAIDDITIDYSPCPRPTNLTLNNVTEQSASISWNAPASGSYEVVYRVYPGGTNQVINTNTNSVVINGLSSLTNYAVWVRKICGSDTSLYSDGMTFKTSLCSSAAYDTIGTGVNTEFIYPVNNYYNYTQSQTIYRSEELGSEAKDFSAIGYEYAYSIATSDKTDVDIYLSHTDKTEFTSTTDFVEIDSSFVLVYSGDLNAEQGWNLYGFDTVFSYDGVSNLLVTVIDNSGSYNGSSYIWKSTVDTAYTTIVGYSDSYVPNVSSLASYTGSKYTYMSRANTMFVSCGVACPTPSLFPVTDVAYNQATMNWFGIADSYEIAVKAAAESAYPEPTTVTAQTFTATGLQPATLYRYHVRAICDAEEGLVSDWAEGTFTTDSLPCFAPSDLTVDATNYTTATLSWTAGEQQNQWKVRVWNTAYDSTYVANSNPFTVTGLTASMSYNAEVSAICGGGIIESEPSETVQFTTQTCERVTGVVASNITNTTVHIAWTNSASRYFVVYGTEGFMGAGDTIYTNQNSCDITGLTRDHDYDVYVYAICENGVYSVASTVCQFTTANNDGVSTVDGAMNVALYPNPAKNSTTLSLSGVNGEMQITIVDMNGRVVMTDTMSCEGDCVKQMELTGLAQGAYFVRVSGDNVNLVKKLVVK